MSTHLSMAISRMKASSDVASLVRDIVLMACISYKLAAQSGQPGSGRQLQGQHLSLHVHLLLHMCIKSCSSPQAARRP